MTSIRQHIANFEVGLLIKTPVTAWMTSTFHGELALGPLFRMAIKDDGKLGLRAIKQIGKIFENLNIVDKKVRLPEVILPRDEAEARAVLDKLISYVNSGDYRTTKTAIKLIGYLGEQSGHSVFADYLIRELANHEEQQIRYYAGQGIGRCGTRYYPQLIEMLQDPKAGCYITALIAIQTISEHTTPLELVRAIRNKPYPRGEAGGDPLNRTTTAIRTYDLLARNANERKESGYEIAKSLMDYCRVGEDFSQPISAFDDQIRGVIRLLGKDALPVLLDAKDDDDEQRLKDYIPDLIKAALGKDNELQWIFFENPDKYAKKLGLARAKQRMTELVERCQGRCSPGTLQKLKDELAGTYRAIHEAINGAKKTVKLGDELGDKGLPKHRDGRFRILRRLVA